MISRAHLRKRGERVAANGPFLVSLKENLRYLAGTESASFMVVPVDRGPVLLVPRLEQARAKAESWVGDIREFQKGKMSLEPGEECMFLSTTKALVKVLEELRVEDLAFDSLSSRVFSELSAFLPARSPLVEDMRLVKSREEIQLIEKAREITEEAYQAVQSELARDLTELQLAGRVYYEMMSRGALAAFEPIAAFGENTAFPHHTPGDRKLASSPVVLMDIGAKVGGYCSDITRTVVMAPGPMEESLKRVRDAMDAVVDGMEPGMKLSDIDARAREVMGGEDPHFVHSLGHGLGLCVHEAPTVSPSSDTLLEDGMVFTIEPGLYYKRKYGVRWEEDFVCWRGKVRML
jgi:Xaa-Pro dipeptidase